MTLPAHQIPARCGWEDLFKATPCIRTMEGVLTCGRSFRIGYQLAQYPEDDAECGFQLQNKSAVYSYTSIPRADQLFRYIPSRAWGYESHSGEIGCSKRLSRT